MTTELVHSVIMLYPRLRNTLFAAYLTVVVLVFLTCDATLCYCCVDVTHANILGLTRGKNMSDCGPFGPFSRRF